MNEIIKKEFSEIIESININAFKNKTIAITGANGLIGSYLVNFFDFANKTFGLNTKVCALVRNVQKSKSLFENNENLFFIEQDLNQPIKESFTADYIIHAASNAHPLAFSKNPVETMKTNLIGTINLLEMIKGTSTKFLYISSGEIYGNNVDGVAFKESDVGKIDSGIVRSCYPESKRAAETLCISYSAQYDVKTNIARLCYVYGASITDENSRADAQFLRNALNGEDIVMKSEGLQRRTYCYVADCVSALLSILLNGANAQVYNVANPNSIASVREYAQTLAELSGVNLKFELPDSVEAKGYSKPLDSILDSSKLLSLGWKPTYSLKDGLFNTLKIKKEGLICSIK